MPSRTCIGCGEVRPQGELVRLWVRGGSLMLGRGPGRGAYLCGPGCGAQALRKRAFARALRGRVMAGPEELARLFELEAVDEQAPRD